jgi:hypothetical protein
MTVSGVNGTIQVPSILNGVAVDFNGCDAANCGSAIPNFQHIKITGGSGPTYTVDPNLVSAGSHAVTSYPVVTARASFSGVNQTTMTISDASGTVPVPAQLFGQNVGGRSSVYGGGNAIVRSGSGPYTVDPNTITPGPVTIIPIPGAQGLYKVSGGTGSGSMTYRQYGWGGGTYSGYGPSGPTHLIGGITATNSFVATMAPVINSKFAAGFLASQSPDRYMFERGMTQNCNTGSMTQSLQSFACGIATGIDSMVKYYQGSSYTAPTGDTISPGFYLFATTANPETDTAIGATFNFVSDCGVSTATVIGENRSIPISGCSFSDMFQNAWTTHIYKLQ